MKYLKWAWRVVRAGLELLIGLLVLGKYGSPDVAAAAVGLYAAMRSIAMGQAFALMQQFNASTELSMRILERVGADDVDLVDEVKEAREIMATTMRQGLWQLLLAAVPVTILFWAALLQLLG